MSNAVIDEISDVLAPIEGDNPCGEDLRADMSPSSVYYQIKSARDDARADERRVIKENDTESLGKLMPGWATVLELAPEILTNRSKDLEIVAWYTEAKLRAEGFAGLHAAFVLTRELIERYWDNLYPQPDEDGILTRVAPLTGLNGDDAEGTLIAPMSLVPITQGYTDGVYATWQYQQAYELEKVVDEEKRQARVDSGAVTMSQVVRSASETPVQFYKDLIASLDACSTAFAQLSEVLSEKAGDLAPPTSNIRNALKTVRDIVGFITKDMFMETTTAAVSDASTSPSSALQTVMHGVPDVIGNRDEAMRVLLKVADYFRKTEPHSPISYSLEQAVRWSRMSLPELLEQLIPDESSRNEYFRLTGVVRKTE